MIKKLYAELTFWYCKENDISFFIGFSRARTHTHQIHRICIPKKNRLLLNSNNNMKRTKSPCCLGMQSYMHMRVKAKLAKIAKNKKNQINNNCDEPFHHDKNKNDDDKTKMETKYQRNWNDTLFFGTKTNDYAQHLSSNFAADQREKKRTHRA